MKKKLKSILLTGLAVIVPIGLTLYILIFIINLMDVLLTIIPVRYQPDTLLPFHIPGLGIIVTVMLVFICGLLTQSYFGNRLVMLGERLVDKIPIVRSIYQAIKSIADGMFKGTGQNLKKVVLVEFPREGIYSVGFVTGRPNEEIRAKMGENDNYISIFVPTTPNPTTGFFLMVPENELIYTDMLMEEAFTLVISGGIVTPPNRCSKVETGRD
ncbi:MAG: DUF502 domain-containing protein [Syntrophales bacterium]|nr:DUF502 domain-containing protein [Syntrophales bacterium]